MQTFIDNWHQAAYISAGLFWMAFWAFGLGYLLSSMIQVFVTRQRMRDSMGQTGAKSVAIGTFFGFISSSCSFAALSTTRALFAKGAGIIPSLAFLLASTNLVIELGIVIAVYLGWQFVVGEYVGGLVLILLMWLVIRLIYPSGLIQYARERAQSLQQSDNEEQQQDWKSMITSREGWLKVAHRYVMEWKMVWKEVTIGFTVAGIISAFLPQAFFTSLFIGAGQAEPAFWQVLLQTLVGPVAAFFTFIGSMGNIPLAAVLYENGVSFAGVMAFIFSDLVVLPVLRIQANYYGWRMALFILAVFLCILVVTSLLLHYGFLAFDLLPELSAAGSITGRDFFAIDYTFFLNLLFIILSICFVYFFVRKMGFSMQLNGALSEQVLFFVACGCLLWLVTGWVVI